MSGATIFYKNFRLFAGLMFILIYGCSCTREFSKDCDLCRQLNENEVKTSLNDFVHNGNTSRISKEAETLLFKNKETLRHGHKFIECGCRENKLIYRLWCANDETFELEVTLSENNQFAITGIQAAEFPHP